jgi:hypothetical protein
VLEYHTEIERIYRYENRVIIKFFSSKDKERMSFFLLRLTDESCKEFKPAKAEVSEVVFI